MSAASVQVCSTISKLSPDLGELRPQVHLRPDGLEEVRDVLGEHVGVERRLLGHSDLLPQRAIVGDHRLAEDRLQPIEILDVVVGLGDEHVLEMLGLGDEHDALVGHVDRNDGAIALGHLHEHAHRVVADRPRNSGVNLNQMLLSSPKPWDFPVVWLAVVVMLLRLQVQAKGAVFEF
jgi:hypothetical protein